MSRVNTSPPPPGPSGMMILTGRDGHSCAGVVATAYNHVARTIRPAKIRVTTLFSPRFVVPS
jgi:hypothetical protein